MDKVIAWMQDPQTWRGIVYILTATGITLEPDMQNAIIAVGLAVAGLIHVVKKDHTTTK